MQGPELTFSHKILAQHWPRDWHALALRLTPPSKKNLRWRIQPTACWPQSARWPVSQGCSPEASMQSQTKESCRSSPAPPRLGKETCDRSLAHTTLAGHALAVTQVRYGSRLSERLSRGRRARHLALRALDPPPPPAPPWQPATFTAECGLLCRGEPGTVLLTSFDF